MNNILVGREEEFDDDQRKKIVIDGREVAVLRFQDRYYAFENNCCHMGGPVGEGIVIGKIEPVVSDDGRVIKEQFSSTEIHIVCPWHGWEYDISSGLCAGDKAFKLRTFTVVTDKGNVYIAVS